MSATHHLNYVATSCAQGSYYLLVAAWGLNILIKDCLCDMLPALAHV
jgi:hypothetical protein